MPPPSGLVGWWPLNGDWTDLAGGDTGISTTTNFMGGEVGLAMVFDGFSSSVRIPASTNLNVGPGGGMSIELWINPNNIDDAQPLVEWNSNAGVFSGIGAHFWIANPALGGGSGSLWANFFDGSAVPHQLSTTTGLLVANTNQHVAVTYDKSSGLMVIYLNGASVAQTNLGSSFAINTSSDVYLGLRPAGGGGPIYFNGVLDEVSIYNRGLTAAEILSIYNAGNAGKCGPQKTPNIIGQPANQAVLTGSPATFAVLATGSPLLSYQWSFNGTNLTGATGSSFTLSGAQPADAGLYAVTVTNVFGSTVSSNATLTVNTAPFIAAQPQSLSVSPGVLATFSVTAGGDSPLAFQWRFNNSILAGATNSSLIIAAVQSTNAGNYQVLVSNPFGSLLSSNAVLQVNVPPAIVAQPANITATTGNDVTFTAGVIGSLPLSYQWNFDGTNISGATGSALTLANVQPANAGAYAVTVTNAYGSAISSNASLTVNSINCAPAPSGLVGWWPLDGNWTDVISGQPGVPSGGANFTAGKVGQAMVFNGSTSSLRIPASTNLNVGIGGGMSIETWIKPANASAAQPLVEWNSNVGSFGGIGAHFWLGVDGPGSLWVNLIDSNSVPHQFSTTNGLIVANTYQHVAITYDKPSGLLSVYVNGSVVGQANLGSNFVANTTSDIYLGLRPAGGGGPTYYAGALDEVSIYNRALTGTEVQGIYNAGAGGKCQSPNPPTIFAQPASQTVVVGGDVSLSVGVAGTSPFGYQWEFDGTNILGATASTLTLSNVQMNAAGVYAVTVTNVVGSITSSNALLTVTPPPSGFQIVSVTATSGIVTVPINLIAQGNENAVGFSVNFNPALLSFIGVTLGDGAAGGALLYNANLANSGKLGLGISLPVNSTFASGTQTVVNVSFFVTALTSSQTTPVAFGDQPLLRQAVDSQANILSATYVGGTVSIPSVTNSNFGIEGDVSPTAGGDGAVTIADWVQEGRFVAGLDTITNATIYERADCAPRSALGDGQLTIADWVQVGRYALGLDPITPSGGPSTGNGESAPSDYHPFDLGPRKLVVVPPISAIAGQTCRVSIQLAAQSDENAVGFSLNFDPAELTFSSASVGSNATGALFNVNSYQAASGKLGVALALNGGTSFTAGTQEVMQAIFTVTPSAQNPASISFGSQPVFSQTADPGAGALTTTYVNGIMSITPISTIPVLEIALVPDNQIIISWPAAAVGFNLESSAGLNSGNWSRVSATTVTNAETISATLTISGSQQLFRLHRP